MATRHPVRNKDDLSVKLPAKMAAIENRKFKRRKRNLQVHRPPGASTKTTADGLSNSPTCTRRNYTNKHTLTFTIKSNFNKLKDAVDDLGQHLKRQRPSRKFLDLSRFSKDTANIPRTGHISRQFQLLTHSPQTLTRLLKFIKEISV